MKTTLFNPLKVYRNNLDVVDFLFRNLTKTGKTVTVPYASHCYYTLPLKDKIQIEYNFTDVDFYNFWVFVSNNSTVMCELKKKLFKPPPGQFQSYFTMIEDQYHSGKNLHFKPILTLMMSRMNTKPNLFGGPYDLDYDNCFSDWFYNKLSKYSNSDMQISFQKKLDYENGFFIQYIPAPETPAHFELFGDSGTPYDVLNKMSNYLLVCEDPQEQDRIEHVTKMNFDNLTLLAKVS